MTSDASLPRPAADEIVNDVKDNEVVKNGTTNSAAVTLPKFDASTMSDRQVYRLLTLIGNEHGPRVRNVFASQCKTFCRVNRTYCVTSLVTRGARTAGEFYTLLMQFSNLRAVVIDDATHLPRMFVSLFRRTVPSLDVDLAADAKPLQVRDRQTLELLHELTGATHLNPIERLKLNRNASVTSADLAHLKYFVNLTQLIVNEFMRVSTLGFLYDMPARENFVLLDLARCLNLSAEPVHVPEPASLAEVDAVAAANADFDNDDADDTRKIEEINDDEEEAEEAEEAEEETERTPEKAPPRRELVFDYVQVFGQMPELRSLSVRLCPKLNSNVLRLVAHNSPFLGELDVHSCEWISDGDFVHIQMMPLLTSLNCGNNDTLTYDALKFVTYINQSCLDTMRQHHEILYNDNDDDGDDDDDDDEKDDWIVSFMRKYRPEARQFYELEVVPGRVGVHEQLDSITRSNFSLLTFVDLSWCKFQSFDVLVLTKFLAARRVMLDGCDIFVNYHDIDQVFAKFASRQPRSGNGPAAIEFREGRPHSRVTVNANEVARHFLDPTEFANSFDDTEWQRTSSVLDVSMHRCTFSGINLHEFSKWPVRASDAERREVIGRYIVLFAKHLRHVEKLSLSSVRAIDKYSLPYAAYWMRSLNSVDLSGCERLDDEALVNFTEMLEAVGTQLLRIRVDDCARLSTAGIAYFLRGQQALVHFSADRCIDATNAAFRDLPPHLERLDVAGCSKLTKNFLNDIDRRCPNLQSLDISNTLVNDECLVKNVGKCQRLEALLVNGCERVSDIGVVFVCGACSSLRMIAMERTPGVSREAVVACVLAIPDRQIQVKA